MLSKRLRDPASDGSDINWGKPCRFHGVAYRDGLAYRITDKLDPSIKDPLNDDRYLWDHAVRLTHNQMGENLTGKPLLFEHDKRKRVGTIYHNWVDDEGRLNIIGEIEGRSDLGRWVARQVRAGILTDLSIGYDTAVEPGTRKVLHKGIEEVSFVVGGFFPGCKVKVRASGNKTYKNSSGEEEIQLENKSSTSRDLKIFEIMENPTSSSTTSQTPAAATQGASPTPMDIETSAAPPSTSSAATHVHQIAEMKKLMLQLKNENESLRQVKADWDEEKKKERERYAKENEEKYKQILTTVEELAKDDGETGISDQYKQQVKAMAMDPSGAEMFKNTVRVTASVKRLKTENEKLKKEVEEAKKHQELASSLLMNDPVFTDQRESKRSAKLAARKKNSSSDRPMGGLMEVDREAPHTALPKWLSQLGVNIDRESETWKSYGTSDAPVQQQQQQQMVTGQDSAFAGSAPAVTVEQPISRPVIAGVNRKTQQHRLTPYKSRYNPEIKYPTNPYGNNSSGQRDLWNFIAQTPSSVSLDGALAHLGGKNFAQIH